MIFHAGDSHKLSVFVKPIRSSSYHRLQDFHSDIECPKSESSFSPSGVAVSIFHKNTSCNNCVLYSPAYVQSTFPFTGRLFNEQEIDKGKVCGLVVYCGIVLVSFWCSETFLAWSRDQHFSRAVGISYRSDPVFKQMTENCFVTILSHGYSNHSLTN